jgi:hypothetical protein
MNVVTEPAAKAPLVAVPRHWHAERDADNLLWLTFDKSDANTNTLSQDALAAFEAVLDELETDRPKGLVIRSGKANGFIAGADVGEFRGLADAAEVERLVLRGHAILDRLERLPYPTVALIHGFCLGAAWSWRSPAATGWRATTRGSACRKCGSASTRGSAEPPASPASFPRRRRWG